MSVVAVAPKAGDDAPGVSPDVSPSVAEDAPRERHSLSLDQRRALRRWANSQTVRPSHKACIEWFAMQYGQTISQSTVSHSLSPKYVRLDGDPQLSGSRLRFGNWPDVEKLVLMWHHSMVNAGRQPTNEELAEKAKNIFQQLPRYKDEQPPEFSPGWIHRFKRRYGLLIRRQRRHGTAPPPQDDLPYLVDTVPRFVSITPDTSPTAIREAVNRMIGVEPSLTTCARVRDEIVRRTVNAPGAGQGLMLLRADPHHVPDGGGGTGGGGDTTTTTTYAEEDPEIMLQNALQALQQEEADAEAQAAVERDARDRVERGLPPLGPLGLSYAQQAAGAALATPVRNGVAGAVQTPSASGSVSGQSSQHQHQQHQQQQPPQQHQQQQQQQPQQPQQPPPTPQSQQQQGRFTPVPGGADDLTLTPIPANGPVSSTDRPQRCPFCINHRMLRTIKEAIEHLSTHVVV